MNKNKKLINALLVSAMMLGNVAPVAFAASENPTVIRLGGSSRVETSVKVSNEAYKGKSDNVVIAGYNGEADALTGTLLAAEKEAPLLLVSNKADDIKQVKAELVRLGAKNVYLLGGAGVISEDIEAELSGYNVTRVKGADRFETAVKVAESVKGAKKHVFLANDGRNDGSLSDALAAGPVSGDRKMPVLLTSKTTVPTVTMNALKDMDVEKVTIVGGTGAVNADVQKQLSDAGYTVDRINGTTRWETAEKIATRYFENNEKVIIANDGRSTGKVEVYADALMGGYLGAKEYAPILLSVPGTLNETTKNYLNENASFAYVLGGEAAISKKVLNEVEEALTLEVVEEALAVESVSAINANELLVTFTQEVDKATAQTIANYTIDGDDLKGSDAVTLNKDKKSVTIKFATTDGAVTGGLLTKDTAYTVAVKKDKIFNADKTEKVPAFTTGLFFVDNEKPTVETVVAEEDGSVVVTFSEKLASTAVNVTINGVKSEGLTPSENKVTVPNTDKSVKDLEKGKSYPVFVQGATDLATNEMNLYKGTFKYDFTSVAPVLKTIEAKDEKTITMEFNKELESISTLKGKLKVYLGREVLAQTTDYDIAVALDEKSQPIVGTYEITFTNNTAKTKFYKKDATSASVDVVLEDYEDTFKNKGEKIEKSVTLTLNEEKPAVKSVEYVKVDASNNPGNIVIELDQEVKASDLNKAISIKSDKTGATYTVEAGAAADNKLRVAATLDADTITIFNGTKGKEVLEDGTYTVTIAKDALTDKNLNENKNALIKESVVVKEEVDPAAKDGEVTKFDKDGSDNNKFDVEFTEKVSPTALVASNYKIDGKVVEGLEVNLDPKLKKAVVTIPEGTFKETKERLVTIDGIKTTEGKDIKKYESLMTINDNTAPEVTAELNTDGTMTLSVSDDISTPLAKADFTVSFKNSNVKVTGSAIGDHEVTLEKILLGSDAGKYILTVEKVTATDVLAKEKVDLNKVENLKIETAQALEDKTSPVNTLPIGTVVYEVK